MGNTALEIFYKRFDGLKQEVLDSDLSYNDLYEVIELKLVDLRKFARDNGIPFITSTESLLELKDDSYSEEESSDISSYYEDEDEDY
jgi:hypothetical protein